MAGWTDAYEVDMLEAFFTQTAVPIPTHIGLFTTSPNDAGTGGSEVVGGSYARVAFTANGTNWGNTSAGAPSSIQNKVAVTFPQASANWGTIRSWGYFSASTGGNLMFWAALTVEKAVNSGDTAEFPVGSIVAKLGDPTDSY